MIPFPRTVWRCNDTRTLFVVEEYLLGAIETVVAGEGAEGVVLWREEAFLADHRPVLVNREHLTVPVGRTFPRPGQEWAHPHQLATYIVDTVDELVYLHEAGQPRSTHHCPIADFLYGQWHPVVRPSVYDHLLGD